MKKIIISLVLICLSIFSFKYSTAKEVKRYTKIKITTGETIITANINDSKTGEDFLKLLPLETTLSDYVKKEKIFYLPAKLSTENAPYGIKPTAGDIAYYAPWGNIAIFYKDAPYANGLILIGKIDAGVKKLGALGDKKIKIEVIK
ncbi:hypothetical protein Dip510_000785 [Elusimicrobium posterum]|uniref:cyclophilin-like fold protein n=1 Tax=Elusimicrobium posterum TaxID=3116653 RepID=UPI003C774FFC